MSKVAEAMKVYEVYLYDHTPEEAKELLEEQGFFVTHEETSDPGDLPAITKLTVEGLVDPFDIFEDIMRVSDPETSEILHYFW